MCSKGLLEELYGPPYSAEKEKLCFLTVQRRPSYFTSRLYNRFSHVNKLENLPQLYPGKYEINFDYKDAPCGPITWYNNVPFGKSAKRELDLATYSIGPDPCKYFPTLMDPTQFEPCYKPFNSATKRVMNLGGQKSFKMPGPCYYDTTQTRKEYKTNEHFGKKREIFSDIKIKCQQECNDQCKMCEMSLEKHDFFQKDKVMLCVKCYAKVKNKKKFQGFEKVRDCGFMHLHQGAKSFFQILSDKELRTLKRREAYLSLYF